MLHLSFYSQEVKAPRTKFPLELTHAMTEHNAQEMILKNKI